MYKVGSQGKSEEFEPYHKRFFGGKLRGGRKQDSLQDSMPSLPIPVTLNKKRTITSRNSTTESSQTRSMMESRAALPPASLFEDREYYQVPVMIPETVLESPEHMATEGIFSNGETRGLGFPGLAEVGHVLGTSWDIWAGPSDDVPGASVFKLPPAVYPGDENTGDSPNLRFLTIHHDI
jgi:hypothetical protein